MQSQNKLANVIQKNLRYILKVYEKGKQKID